MKLPIHLATPLKDFLLELGWEQIPVDRVSGVLKFKLEEWGSHSYIWVDRFFPDSDLTLTGKNVSFVFIEKWLTTQTSN